MWQCDLEGLVIAGGGYRAFFLLVLKLVNSAEAELFCWGPRNSLTRSVLGLILSEISGSTVCISLFCHFSLSFLTSLAKFLPA
jgi:hypothetical protein